MGKVALFAAQKHFIKWLFPQLIILPTDCFIAMSFSQNACLFMQLFYRQDISFYGHFRNEQLMK
jgi:hypothetical protein